MSTIVSRLDIVQIFCDVDDFCHQWENLWQQVPQLTLIRQTSPTQPPSPAFERQGGFIQAEKN